MDSTLKAQIIQHENALLDAMKTSNADLLERLLHDDLLFNGPTGDTATKALDLANYRSGGVHLHTVESRDMLLSAIADDVVVVVTVKLQGNYLGHDIDGKFRYLRVWKQFGEQWKVIAGSVVPIS